MQQLSGHDASFLGMETRTVYGHGAGLCILEPSPTGTGLTLDRLVGLLEERLPLAPLLRRKLASVPFGLDQPYWVEDSEIDLLQHIFEISLPIDADENTLCEQVASLHTRHLDRTRPLWEIHLIHGLADGRQALFLKIHHSVIDGVGGNELLVALFEARALGQGIGEPSETVLGGRRSAVEMLGRSAVSAALRLRRVPVTGYRLARSVPSLLGEPTRRRLPLIDRMRPRAHTERLSSVSLRAPQTPFNIAVGPHRKVALATLDVSDVLAVKQALGITVNDVVMAVCAGALRRWLSDAGSLPDGPLLAAAPVAFRSSAESDNGGNQFSMLIAILPTDRIDPVERALAAAEAMRGAKKTYGALPPTLLSDVTQFALPVITAPSAGLAGRLRVLERLRPFNLMISNVRGPAVGLSCAGQRVAAYYPLSQVVDGQALNITLMSYENALYVGLLLGGNVSLELAPLASLISDELQVLLDATSTSSRKRAARRP